MSQHLVVVALCFILILTTYVTSIPTICTPGTRIYIRNTDIIQENRGFLLLLVYMPLQCSHCHRQLRELNLLAETISELRVAVVAPEFESKALVDRLTKEFAGISIDRDENGLFVSTGHQPHDITLYDRCGRVSHILPHSHDHVTSYRIILNVVEEALQQAKCGWCQYDSRGSRDLSRHSSSSQDVKQPKNVNAYFKLGYAPRVDQSRSQTADEAQRTSYKSHQAQQQQYQQYQLQQQQQQQQQQLRQQNWNNQQQQQNYPGYPRNYEQEARAQQIRQQQQLNQQQRQQQQQQQTRQNYQTNQYQQGQQNQNRYQQEQQQQSRVQTKHYNEVQQTNSPSSDYSQQYSQQLYQQQKQLRQQYSNNQQSGYINHGIHPTIAPTAETTKNPYGPDEDYEDSGFKPIVVTTQKTQTQIPQPTSSPWFPTLVTPHITGMKNYQVNKPFGPIVSENNIPCSAYTDDICYQQQEKLGRFGLSKCCSKGVYFTDVCVPGKCSNSTVQLCCFQKFLQSKFSCCEDSTQSDGTTSTNKFNKCCYERFVDEDLCCTKEAASQYWPSVHELCYPNTNVDYSSVKMEVRFSEGLRVIDLSENRLWDHECRYGGNRIQYAYLP